MLQTRTSFSNGHSVTTVTSYFQKEEVIYAKWQFRIKGLQYCKCSVAILDMLTSYPRKSERQVSNCFFFQIWWFNCIHGMSIIISNWNDILNTHTGFQWARIVTRTQSEIGKERKFCYPNWMSRLSIFPGMSYVLLHTYSKLIQITPLCRASLIAKEKNWISFKRQNLKMSLRVFAAQISCIFNKIWTKPRFVSWII